MNYVSFDVDSYPSDGEFVVTEMDERWYWHFMNCVPPIHDRRLPFGFMVGEAYSHIERSGRHVPTYRWCFNYDGRYYSVVIPVDFSVSEISAIISEVRANNS